MDVALRPRGFQAAPDVQNRVLDVGYFSIKQVNEHLDEVVPCRAGTNLDIKKSEDKISQAPRFSAIPKGICKCPRVDPILDERLAPELKGHVLARFFSLSTTTRF
jgi:hypothetical protein